MTGAAALVAQSSLERRPCDEIRGWVCAPPPPSLVPGTILSARGAVTSPRPRQLGTGVRLPVSAEIPGLQDALQEKQHLENGK